MSRSILHDWECAIERISGDSANEMLDIAQDIYNTGYVRGKNYMSWVYEDIKAEIEQEINTPYDHDSVVLDQVYNIIDRHIKGVSE